MVKRKSVSPVEVEHLKKQFKLIQETMKNVIGDASDPESDVDSSSTEEVRDHLSEDEDPETDPDRQSSKENDNVKGEGDPSTKKQEENNGEIPMNEEFAEIFGLDPNASKAIESKLHSGILSRWKFWASKGQKADDVEKLLEKYQSPTGLEEPKLNPEILLKLAKHSKTRDSHMTKRQRLIGAALTSLGSAMSSLMDDTESIDKLIFMERMNDIGKILTEIFYSQTKSRIAFILAGLDKETKALLEDRQTEEFLFGKNLSKRIKEAKAMDKDQNAPSGSATIFDGMQSLRKAFINKNIPTESIDIILSSLAPNTVKQYISALRAWWDFCNNYNLDFYSPTRNDLLNFLTKRFQEGASYGTINTYRSAVSLILHDKIGDDPLIRRFLKGIFRLNPTKPKYNFTWDVSIVLNYLLTLNLSVTLNLKLLTEKLVTLLALTTAHRPQTLSLIKLSNIKSSPRGIEIQIPDIIKTSGPGRYQPLLTFTKFTQDPALCVVSVLEDYIENTKQIRNNVNELFITLNKPYKAVTAQTISR